MAGSEENTACAMLPNGSRLALEDGNLMSANARNDLAKAAAVAAEFNVVFDCALCDAVAVYEQLLNCSEKDTAHRLVERARRIYRSLKVEMKTADKTATDNPPKRTVH